MRVCLFYTLTIFIKCGKVSKSSLSLGKIVELQYIFKFALLFKLQL